MNEYTEHHTRRENMPGLTLPDTLNYDTIRSGSTRRWATEHLTRSSGNGLRSNAPRKKPKSRVREMSGSSNMALTAVTVFLRLSWRTVAAIVARVVQDLSGKTDQLDGLTRIGIDEISYRKGHRYLTCVVDHDTGRLVWAHEGRNKDTLALFFDALGPTRSALLTHVSADGAEWIHSVVREKAPKAAICLDPFHVVMWCTKALDKVRRRTLDHAGDRDRKPAGPS